MKISGNVSGKCMALYTMLGITRLLTLCLTAKKCEFCTSEVKLTPVIIFILELLSLYFFSTFAYLARNK